MADEEHLMILEQGIEAWNSWRSDCPDRIAILSLAELTRADLAGADLAGADLARANLAGANLRAARLAGADLAGANLVGSNLAQADLTKANLRKANLNTANLRAATLRAADLVRANLTGTNLTGANLTGANLTGANLTGANLREATLRGAFLSAANLRAANLRAANLGKVVLGGAILQEATLFETVFYDVYLSSTLNLDECRHIGPSCVDHRTLAKSKDVPLTFWRGCGLPDAFVDYLPSLTGQAIQFFSCFISYSSKDQEFADRLHADLQNVGVRCWFAPHDLPIGAKTWDGIDEAIRTRDKVMLILSDSAIASNWVEDEVTKAFAEERRRNEVVLFPVRLDDAVLETSEPWANKLRERNIGDFTKWKEHDAYKATFDRVLRDLTAEH